MRHLSAKLIFNGENFLSEGSVLTFDNQGVLREILHESKHNASEIEYFEGILTPGFINAHCHLELSHLKSIIPEKTGLVSFAKNIIVKRNSVNQEILNEAMRNADLEMKNEGIVAVGDISNTNVSFQIKAKSKLFYHTFIELIGLHPEKKEAIYNEGLLLLKTLQSLKLEGSLAAHAPYSCSIPLIEAIIRFNEKTNSPFSIHNQETNEENIFLQGKTSEFHQLYEFLNFNINWFKPHYESSISAYASFLSKDRNILVHNTATNKADVVKTNKQVYWCLCPTANLYIENKLPDFSILDGEKICFGTDSLASNHNLSIIKEATIFYKETKDLTKTLRGLCSYGAQAIGIEHKFGYLKPSYKCGLNLIEDNNANLSLKRAIL